MKKLLILLILPLFFACSSENSTTNNVPNYILTDKANGISPFPWDYYTEISESKPTGISVKIPTERENDIILTHLGNMLPALNSLSGFGINAPIIIKFSKQLDPKTVADTYNNRCTDETSPYILITISGEKKGELVPLDIKSYDNNHLIIYPFVALDPKTTYSLIITDKLKSIDGSLIKADSFYNTIINDDCNSCKRIKKERDDTIELLKNKFNGKINQKFILSFTTMDLIEPIQKTKEFIDKMTATEKYPATFTTNIISYTENYSENTGLLIKGKIKMYNFMKNHKLTYDYTTKLPQLTGYEEIHFLYFLPKKSEEPFPVMIFQHGLLSSKEKAFNIADEYNKKGIAVFAIDFIYHGERNPRPKDFLNIFKNFIGINIKDGKWDINPNYFMEGIRGMALNHFQLIDFISSLKTLDIYNPATGKMEADGKTDIKTEHLGYEGVSLGSMTGTLTSIFSDKIGATVLNVSGGGISKIILSHFAYKIAGEEIFSFKLPDPWDENRFYQILQTIWDQGDNGGFVKYLFKEGNFTKTHVLMQNALKDEVMPISSTKYIARTMGIELYPPLYYTIDGVKTHNSFPIDGVIKNINNNITAGMSEYYIINNNSEPAIARHGTLFYSTEAAEQSTSFIKSYFDGLDTGKAPKIDKP